MIDYLYVRILALLLLGGLVILCALMVLAPLILDYLTRPKDDQ